MRTGSSTDYSVSRLSLQHGLWAGMPTTQAHTHRGLLTGYVLKMPILSPRIDIAPSRLAPFAYSEQKRGLYAVGLYVVQMGLGIFIHYIRIPFPFIGHRPPLNYFHGLLGLVTLVLANYQVRLCQRCLLHRAFFLLIRVGEPDLRRLISQIVVLGC